MSMVGIFSFRHQDEFAEWVELILLAREASAMKIASPGLSGIGVVVGVNFSCPAPDPIVVGHADRVEILVR
jgi:hypothetical protein